MKLSLVLFLTVAIYATYAYPEPQPEPLADALAEAFADPLTEEFQLVKFVSMIYKQICNNESKCKEWPKNSITEENVRKFLTQFQVDIKPHCDPPRGNFFMVGCFLYKKYMKINEADNIRKNAVSIYKKMCNDERFKNKCKEWPKDNITNENVREFLTQFEVEIKEYCKVSINNTVKGICNIIKRFMKKMKD